MFIIFDWLRLELDLINAEEIARYAPNEPVREDDVLLLTIKEDEQLKKLFVLSQQLIELLPAPPLVRGQLTVEEIKLISRLSYRIAFVDELMKAEICDRLSGDQLVNFQQYAGFEIKAGWQVVAMPEPEQVPAPAIRQEIPIRRSPDRVLADRLIDPVYH